MTIEWRVNANSVPLKRTHVRKQYYIPIIMYLQSLKKRKEGGVARIPFLRHLYCLRSYTSPFLYAQVHFFYLIRKDMYIYINIYKDIYIYNILDIFLFECIFFVIANRSLGLPQSALFLTGHISFHCQIIDRINCITLSISRSLRFTLHIFLFYSML